MKKFINSLLMLLILFSASSCLKANLDELDTYDGNDITNVRFEYRWWDSSANKMRVINMNVSKTIDKENKTIDCNITVPNTTSTFTNDIRDKVSLSSLAINVDASTAARIVPENNAPVMGAFPSDFSAKTFRYKVTAGNGDAVSWTINITNFQK